jgi:hypothetical protein
VAPIAMLVVFCSPYFFIFVCSNLSFHVERLFMFPIFRNPPPIVPLVIFCFPYFFIFACSISSFHVDRLFMLPIFRNQPPIVSLVVFYFTYTWIITQNPTPPSPPCQTQCSRITTYHNIIFPLKILKGLVTKLRHVWLRLVPIWLHLLPIWLCRRCASLMYGAHTPLMYGCIFIWLCLKAIWLRQLNMVVPL